MQLAVAGPSPIVQQSGACGLQGKSGDPLQMPRGDDPEDSWGIQSWEVRAKTGEEVHLARGTFSFHCEGDEATAEGRTGGHLARVAFASVAESVPCIEAGESRRRRWCLPNFPKNIIPRLRRGRLSPEARALVEELFRKIDHDGSDEVTRSEAMKFFGQGFGKMSADAMFSEVDADNNQAISVAEFRSFWEQVKSSGYDDNELIEELREMLEGGHWVDFNHRRTSQGGQSLSAKHLQQPRQSHIRASAAPRRRSCRPLGIAQVANIADRLRRQQLSREARKLIQEIFSAIDKDGSDEVTKSEALKFFGNGFGKMSVDAMFNEVDTDDSNAISVAEFKSFWEQVKRSGYTNKQIVEELRELLGGGAWVDFDDTRQVAGGCKTKSAKNWKK
jgi:Ca2+-binding EF-hand superfamily protein